jgi:hypothetical protein
MNDTSNTKITTKSGTSARWPTTLRLITQKELQPPMHPAKAAPQGPTKQSLEPDNNDDDPGPAAA